MQQSQLAEWDQLPAWRAAEAVARGAQLVDVRERNEYRAGTLPDAVNIPLSELERRVFELSRSRPVAVFCQSGNRSQDAAELLVSRGFRQVVNLVGGISAAQRRSA